jgi:hypothetical protein
MKTTYINNEGVKCGFIISGCGRWVDCFRENESAIINGFFTFGRHITNQSKPNLTPQFSKNEIALQQRFGVLFRGQKLVVNECDKLSLSRYDLDSYAGLKNKYATNFLNHLETLTKDRQKTIDLYSQLLEM